MTDQQRAYFIGRTTKGKVAIAFGDEDRISDAYALSASRARQLSTDLRTWADRVEEEADDE